MTDDRLLDRLRDAVGDAHVLTDPEVRASYETDWTGRFTGLARCVVRPASTGETSTVVRLCAEAGVPIVPQGGNTGLVGGSVPRGGEVVLSTRRLDQIGEVDLVSGEVVAGAGVTLGALSAHLRQHGLRLGVDLASRDSATIGGMMATNAGGINVLRYGMMRAQVAGFEAVLPAGEVVARLSGMRRDNTGYDLGNLLIGSEGTLGVITRVRLRLVREMPRKAVALLGLDSAAAAVAIASQARASLPSLEAAEIFFAHGMDLVSAHTGLPPPFGGPRDVYLLLEMADTLDPAPALAEFLEPLGVADALFGTEPAERARLWAYRERHTESINAFGVPHKFDVAVPLAVLPGFVEEVQRVAVAAAAAARPILFGHIAEGNLHVNVLGLAPDDELVAEAVLSLVARLGGSISAEHGVGVAKARWLALTRSPPDIAAMRAIKAAIDPHGLWNPGVIFGR